MPAFFPPAGSLARTLAVLALVLAACSTDNRKPELLPVSDQTAVVGRVLEVMIVAADPDGDLLSWEVEGLPATAEAVPVDPGLLLRWAPLSSEADPGGRAYPVVVRAFDGRGGAAEVAFSIVAFPEGGVPVFLTAPGYVLDLATTDRISFPVEVKDDDSASVEISVLEDLPGSHWTRLSDRLRTLTWAPTDEQIASRTFWSLIVGAKDESHPMVVRVISVVLANASTHRECAGTWPLAEGFGAEAQVGVGVEISARLRDPESPIRRVVATWSSLDAQGKVVRSGTEPLRDLQEGYRGTIREADLGSAAVAVDVALRVRDDDDPGSTLCDHELRLPKQGERLVAVLASACPRDEHGPADGGVFKASAGERLRLRLCPGAERTLEVPVGLEDAVAVVAEATDGGALKISLAGEDPALSLGEAQGLGRLRLARAPMNDRGPVRLTVSRPGAEAPGNVEVFVSVRDKACAADAAEPDDTLAEAPLAATATDLSRTLCPGDRDLLRIELGEDGLLDARARFSAEDGDLDLTLLDAEGKVPLRAVRARTDDERLRVGLPAGSYVLEIRAAGAAGTIPYTLDLTVQEGGVCFEDVYAPATASAATAPVQPESYLDGLVLCPGASDHFAHVINAQESYRVEVDALDDRGALQADLIDPEGSIVASGLSVLDSPALPGGRYVIRVSDPMDRGLRRYALFFKVSAQAAGCPEDRFAPNGLPETAALLGSGWTTRLLLCPGDQDHFAIKTAGPRSVRLVAFFASPDTPVVLERIRGDGTVLETARNEGPWAVLDTVLPEKGTHILRISSPGAPTFYDLSVELP